MLDFQLRDELCSLRSGYSPFFNAHPSIAHPCMAEDFEALQKTNSSALELRISAVSQTAITTAYLTLELQVKGKNEECACEAFYQVYLSIKKDPAIQVQSGPPDRYTW